MSNDICGAASPLLFDPMEGTGLDDRTINWLRKQGVSVGAIAVPMAVRRARVTFHLNGNGYRPSVLGDFALIIPVPADPETIITDVGATDLIAWSARSGQIGTRLGNVFGLGVDQIGVDGLGTTGMPTPIPPTIVVANRRAAA